MINNESNSAIAERLLSGEIETNELSETEVDEMIAYFTNDIHNIDNELLKIKNHIIAMQQELRK